MPPPVVLLYHGFGVRTPEQDPHNLFVPVEIFEQQLSGLLRRGFRPLDAAGFVTGLAAGRWPRRAFLVTIDDGYVSTLELAAPLLGRLRVPAVLFALPGLLGATSCWMPEMGDEALIDRAGLKELRGAGVAVGLHGFDHASLAGQDDATLHHQIHDSRNALADAVGELPELFAYPFGAHDLPARRAVADAGFHAAFAIYDRGGRFAWPRVDVNALDTPRTFALKTSRLFPPAKSVLDGAPAVRRLAHSALGKARR